MLVKPRHAHWVLWTHGMILKSILSFQFGTWASIQGSPTIFMATECVQVPWTKESTEHNKHLVFTVPQRWLRKWCLPFNKFTLAVDSRKDNGLQPKDDQTC